MLGQKKQRPELTQGGAVVLWLTHLSCQLPPKESSRVGLKKMKGKPADSVAHQEAGEVTTRTYKPIEEAKNTHRTRHKDIINAT